MVARVRIVDLPASKTFEDYALVEGQEPFIAPFLALGSQLAHRLGTGRIWMVSSTASGGGVAEMLPHTCGLLREAGVDARWLVLEPNDDRFFVVTKALHHLLHGRDAGVALDDDARACFRRVSQEGAEALSEHLEPGDIVVIHDPQPSGIAALLRPELHARLVWRCHIGVPFHNEHTERGWGFLERCLEPFLALVFSSERYVPAFSKSRSKVIQPSIDALSHKNRELSPYKLLGILRSAGLTGDSAPEWARFVAPAERYFERRFAASPVPDLLTSPVILHVSRFDPLKGFDRSLAAFRAFAETGAARARRRKAAEARSVDEVERSLLVLAGPDPRGVADDPEAGSVLGDLCRQRDQLPAAIAARVHLLRLPMVDAKQNALMVNALQRLASVIVQPSVEEGFGLTVTEALWKGVPVVASNVGGISQQIRPRVDGLIVDDTADADAFAEALVTALVMVKQCERMARSARRRVAQHFLSLREATQWLEVLDGVIMK